MGNRGQPGRVSGWRTTLGREVSVLLLFKAVALGLLWWLFFSPVHQVPADAAATGRHLAVEPAAPPPRSTSRDAQAGDRR